MYTYHVHLVNAHCMYKTMLKVVPIARVYLEHPIHPVNSRCLYETPLKVETIVRVHVPNFYLVNSRCLHMTTLKVVRLTVHIYQVRLINLHCLYKICLKVKPIDLVYLTNSPIQLALFVKKTFRLNGAELPFIPTQFAYSTRFLKIQLLISRQLPNSPSKHALCARDIS